MKRIILISLFLTACQAPPGDNTNTNSNSNIVNIFGPNDSTQTPTGCNPVSRVSLNVPTSLKVGESARLDATPKDSQGQPRDPVKCDEKAGIVWTYNSDICSISSATIFVPNITGLKVGTCIVSATVESVTGNGSFQVN